jgi:hypothetical protein
MQRYMQMFVLYVAEYDDYKVGDPNQLLLIGSKVQHVVRKTLLLF